MATYKPAGPGLLQITRDDGQAIVLPMEPHEAEAQGLQPEAAAPSPIPKPDMHNPYSMGSSPDAVAGPGGGPTDLSGGAGVFAAPAPPNPNEFREQLAEAQHGPRSHGSAPGLGHLGDTSKFDVAVPAQEERAKPKLIPVAASAQSPEQGQPEGPNPYLALSAQMHRGGGRPAQLGVTSETKKYHEYGQVDPALSAGITKQQDEIDQGQSNALEDQALHRGDVLEQQQGLLQQQAQAAQVAMQRRQAVDNEITRLNLKSQAAQDELSLAKPAKVDQFWKEKGVGVRLASAIAIIFGGQQAARMGGENTGLKAVNDNIDRWMNDQRQAYEAAKDKATVTNNAYKDALATYGSPELAQTNLNLQALAAKDALIKNQAEQIGTVDALNTAQLALQDSQLQRKKLQAQAQAQAGADVEAKFTMQGGGGGSNPLKIAEDAVKLKKLDEELGNRTLEERKFGLEEKKAGAGKAKASQVSGDAADALDLLRTHSASLSGRSGEGGGETAAIKNDAEAKYTAALIASGVPGRAALGQAKELFEGVGDKVRVTGAQDAKLKKAAALLRGNATRAIARGATGGDEAVPDTGGEGELE